MSISQISETFLFWQFRFLEDLESNSDVISMFAWVLRFGFFAFGDPFGGYFYDYVLCRLWYGV
jgi:NHS family xanthosine MFS transporter